MSFNYQNPLVGIIENQYIIFYFNKENKSVKYKHVSRKFILQAILPR